MSRSVIISGLLLIAVAGCNKKGPPAKDDEVPVIPVSHPVSRVVTDFVDFTGRTDSVKPTNIIARVTGYVVKIPFQEGAEVKKGDLLYVIDPRPYQAQLEQAESQVVLSRAKLDLAKKTMTMYATLSKTQAGSVSDLQLAQYKAQVEEAEASLKAQEKSAALYKMNKDFTNVVSPINGQAGRKMATVGNLVNQDQTLLTTVEQLDPMYVYFDIDEATRLKIIRMIREHKITLPAGGGMTVLMGLQDEPGFPHKATLTFLNNQVNSTTGSITMRAIFDNPELDSGEKAPGTAPAGAPEASKAGTAKASPAAQTAKVSLAATSAGKSDTENDLPAYEIEDDPADAFIKLSTVRFNRQFTPGMFVRVRLPMGEPHPALLVIDRVIQSDQGNKCVYVVEDGKVQQRNIKTGALQEDGLRVVEGLKPDDWIVTGAIQQVRPRMEVKTVSREMPTLDAPAAAPPAKAPINSGQAKSGAKKSGPARVSDSAPVTPRR
jgi:RND family efflux transporter MFP subunit